MSPVEHKPSATGNSLDLRLVFRNARWLLGSSLLIQVLSLISGIILTRHLQASGYGQYAFSYVYGWFVSIIIIFGTRGVLLWYVPRHKEESGPLIAQAMILRCMTATVAIAASLALAPFWDKQPEVQAAMAIFVLMAATDALFQMASDVFRGLEDMRFEGAFYAIERVLVVIGISLAAWLDWPISTIAIMMFGISLFRATLFLLPLRKHLPTIPIRLDWPKMCYLVSESRQYFVVDLATALATRADVLLLAALATDAEVGCYHASMTIVIAMQVLPTVLTNAMQPTAVRLAANDHNTMITTKVWAAQWAFRLFLPLTGIVAGMAPLIMTTLFGESFIAAGNVLRLLMISLPVFYLNGLAANFYFVTDRFIVNLWAGLANAAVVLSLDVLLIPRWGANGAAVAAITAALTALSIYYKLCFATFGRPMLAAVPKPLLAGIVAFGTTAATLPLVHWWSAGIGLAASIAILALFGELRRYELRQALSTMLGGRTA